MNHTEAILQSSCVSWFNLQYSKLLIYSIPNGGKRRFLTAVRDKKMGLLPGIPDLCVPFKNDSYFGLYLELKSEGEFLSDDQIARRKFLLAQGYAVVVVWNFVAFQILVKAYMDNDACPIEDNVSYVDDRIVKLEAKRSKRRTKVPMKIKRRIA